MAIAACIRRIWLERSDVSEAAACADWLLNLLDVRGFAASAPEGGEQNFALYAQGLELFRLIAAPGEASADRRDAYHEWLESSVLNRIAYTQPESFRWLVSRARSLLDSSIEAAMQRVGE
jgi:hypothetical protein